MTTTTDTIERIREMYRQRVDIHRTEKTMTTRLKSIFRRMAASWLLATPRYASITDRKFDKKDLDWVKKQGVAAYEAVAKMCSAKDPKKAGAAIAKFPYLKPASIGYTLPMYGYSTAMAQQRGSIEDELCVMAATLPPAKMFQDAPGLGLLGLAILVGEAGDFSGYPHVGNLWKRFGVQIVDGEPQHRTKNKEKAERFGFNPSRRAALWTIGWSLKMNKSPKNSYRQLFAERLKLELPKVAVLLKSQGVNLSTKKGQQTKETRAKRRAKRYMEKRLLLDVWRLWRQAEGFQVF